MQLAIFHRLGLKIGYLGFPVAGERFDEMDDEAMHRLASEIQKTAGISLLRLVRSGQKEIAPTATAAFPEARIDRLEDWVPKDKRLQKDLAFARRSSADLQIRGQGDLFGSQQSGHDPHLRYADIEVDGDLLQSAQRLARDIIEADPELRDPVHSAVRGVLRARHAHRLELYEVG